MVSSGARLSHASEDSGDDSIADESASQESLTNTKLVSDRPTHENTNPSRVLCGSVLLFTNPHSGSGALPDGAEECLRLCGRSITDAETRTCFCCSCSCCGDARPSLQRLTCRDSVREEVWTASVTSASVAGPPAEPSQLLLLVFPR